MSPIHRFASHALLAGALFSTSAYALTSTGVACDGQGTQMTSQIGYLDCAGSFSGNNLNQAGGVQSAFLAEFGLTGLTSVFNIKGGNGRSDGTLSFAEQSGPFVISLKAGDAFSLYEFAGGVTSVSFDTLGVGFFSGHGHKNIHFGQDLSHATLYAGVAAVPEPSTYAMMLAGLAVLILVAHRYRSKR
jgi:hypothetical protein